MNKTVKWFKDNFGNQTGIFIIVCLVITVISFSTIFVHNTFFNNESVVKVENSIKTSTETEEMVLSYNYENLGNGKCKIYGTTNLVDGFELSFDLSNVRYYGTEVMGLPSNWSGDKLTDQQWKEISKNAYHGQGRSIVNNGKFEMIFSQVKPGKYDLHIYSPIITTQSEKIIEFYGKKAERLKGKYIIDDGKIGRRINFRDKFIFK